MSKQPTSLDEWNQAAGAFGITPPVRAIKDKGFSVVSPPKPIEGDSRHGLVTILYGETEQPMTVRLSRGVCMDLIRYVLSGKTMFKLESRDWTAQPPEYNVKALD